MGAQLRLLGGWVACGAVHRSEQVCDSKKWGLGPAGSQPQATNKAVARGQGPGASNSQAQVILRSPGPASAQIPDLAVRWGPAENKAVLV